VAGPGGEVPVNWTERTLERAGAAWPMAAARPLERPGHSPTGNPAAPEVDLPRRAEGALDSCKCVKGGVDPDCARHTTGEWRK
jgi:hypothetical protein